MELDFRGLTETRPGAAWRTVYAHGWPGWRRWFLARGGRTGLRVRDARRALRRHMPEMESLWDRLVDTAGGDEDAARFLSFWTPPRYLVSCSQLVVTDDDGPVLLRNYDLDPELSESTLLHSAWRGQRVMGMVEGMAGLADGMNEAGLAASLTFGGRPRAGRGFGIPLIIRYVLEMCRDVADAREALRAVPCHMSYNVTVADRAGAWATVFLAPDRPALVLDRPFATNHQLGVEWPQHGRVTRTEQRAAHLQEMLRDARGACGRSALTEFLREPLFSTGYAKGFGTVYTAAYRPVAGEVRLCWREGPPAIWRLGGFRPAQVRIAYSGAGSRVVPARDAAPDAGDAPPALAAFLGELSDCLAGQRAWTSLGTFWERSNAAQPCGDVS